MTRHTQPTRQDVLRSIVYLMIYVTVVFVSASFLLTEYWCVWAVIVLAGMALLVNRHKSKTIYSCPNCEHVFELSFLTDLAAPHGLDRDGAWLLLRCPSCRKRHRTRVLMRDG
jgi:uncharacterized C2H2 Zn-finger protein